MILLKHKLLLTVLLATLLFAINANCQTDEIQVYGGDIANPGEVSLTLHNNFTPAGSSTPSYNGAVIANRSLNGVPEFAYGLNSWCELGLYLPVYTLTANHRLYSESGKLRALFVIPDADKKDFFYGVNFEYSSNARRWGQSKYSGEIRPIIGWRNKQMTFVINPILDSSFDGLSRLDFAPCIRLSYDLSELWTIALEQYSDFGPLNHPYNISNQQQSFFLVLDRNAKAGFEVGIGHGLNQATDKWVIKFIVNSTLISHSSH